MAHPGNIGIISIQSYIPSTYVDQTELEKHDKVPAGKYTVGLGQLQMSCTGDREDVNSMASTVVLALLEKNHINPSYIGRIEVGTETLIDKSKSTKTYLMNIFKNNPNIEGVTSINACYGATQALFNTVAWIESSAWDGRLGIVVAVDIAVYSVGPARATGGAGAVALLVGPNAPIVLDPIRMTCTDHAYDFFKPNGNGEYPIVDGAFSIDCYLQALKFCFERMKLRCGVDHLSQLSNYYIFHSPYHKMVRRAFNYLVFEDCKNNPRGTGIDLKANSNFKDRKLYEQIHSHSIPAWNKRVEPACYLGKMMGNTYCAALYFNLLSLISFNDDLPNKYVTMFSYGSGYVSSMFRLYVRPDAGSAIEKIRNNNAVTQALGRRIKLTPEEYSRRMKQREEDLCRKGYSPSDSLDELADGVFYLVRVDDRFRRYYARKHNPKL